jgi:bifunctional non-homologous end joining protein LigD
VQNAARIQLLTRQVPAAYYAFDLLYRDRHSTLGLSYRKRRQPLESLDLHEPHWDTPPYVAGGGPEALADSLAESRRRALEGVLSKRLASGTSKVKHQ